MAQENDLLRRARRIEEQALAEIYDLYSNELYRYAMRLVGDAQMAEDCVAETFSRFLHTIHRGGGPRKHLRAYLYRIAYNWVTDHYRRKTPDPLPLNPEAPLKDELNLAQQVHTKIEADRVRKILFQLTPEQRQVISLKFLEGWKNEEIALVMDKPVGAVKSLQHRGLAALRRLMMLEELIQ